MTLHLNNLQESFMGKILKAPEPKDIKDLRVSVNLTQQKASELLHSTLRTFQRWEYGTTKMPYAYWELFAIKIEMLKMNGTTL
jgi:DNA-binding transcriptional regulator YiaG